MICEDCMQDLSAYLDDELETERRREFDEHLGGCDACRAQLDDLRKLTSLLQGVPKATAPPGLAGKIVEAAKTADTPRILRFRSWIPAAAAAAAAVLLAVVIGLSGGDRKEEYSRGTDARHRAAPSSEAADVHERAASIASKTDDDFRAKKSAEPSAGTARAPRTAPSNVDAAPPAPAPAAKKGPARRAKIGWARGADGAEGERDELVADANQAALPERQNELVGVRQDMVPADSVADEEALDPSDLLELDQTAEFALGVTGGGAAAQEEEPPSRDETQMRRRQAIPLAEPEKDAPVRETKSASRDLSTTLYVHVTADDISKEAERVRSIARSIGGGGERDLDLEAEIEKREKELKTEGEPRGTNRVVVWVPSDRAGDFFAELEGLTIADAPSEEKGAAPAADAKDWTRIEVVVGPSAGEKGTALADAGGKERDAREIEAEMIRKRMADLLGNKEDSKPPAAAATQLSRVRIDTTIRCHLMPRNDIESERQRVRSLALYYGGKIVYDTAPPRGIAANEPAAMGRIRLKMPARVAAEFVKAARLGFTAPASAKAKGSGPANMEPPEAPPKEWVAVEVTIGREDPAATETTR